MIVQINYSRWTCLFLPVLFPFRFKFLLPSIRKSITLLNGQTSSFSLAPSFVWVTFAPILRIPSNRNACYHIKYISCLDSCTFFAFLCSLAHLLSRENYFFSVAVSNFENSCCLVWLFKRPCINWVIEVSFQIWSESVTGFNFSIIWFGISHNGCIETFSIKGL